MKYFSTRGKVSGIGFSDAVLMGLATDGGLLLPEAIPKVDQKTLDKWRDLSYTDLACEVMSLFVDDIPRDDLKGLVERSYSTFFPSRCGAFSEKGENLHYGAFLRPHFGL